MGFRVGDRWVGGFKFLGMQIGFWVRFWWVYVEFWVLNIGGCMLISRFWLVYGYKKKY